MIDRIFYRFSRFLEPPACSLRVAPPLFARRLPRWAAPWALAAAVWTVPPPVFAVASAAFGMENVAVMAGELAASPYRAPAAMANERLRALSYDDYRDIRFRPQAAWWRDARLPFELQFFHVGGSYGHAVQLHELVDGRPRAIVAPASHFDYGRAAPAVAGQPAAEIAGFRVHHALNRRDYKDEVLVFHGASYMRALGAAQGYGLSARGVAIDTVGAPAGSKEEFPSFDAFWIERPRADSTSLVIYALLNGPRVTGAYRFELRPGAETQVDVKAQLFLRGPVATLGLAPLTSMFLGGENQPQPLHSLGDFRPEVHDSDGLLIASSSGEWLWRPLLNPPAASGPFTTRFKMSNPRGFGLMQRDRAFTSYEDSEARYERRPSLWIAPQGDWGAGRIELMQFHTPDETNDNVAAYWVPETLPQAGQPLSLAYTMRWQGDAQQRPPAGWVAQSRLGRSHESPRPNEVQFQIDFVLPANGAAAASTANAAPKAVVTADNARVLLAEVYPHPIQGWRLTLKVQRQEPQEPTELRAFLKIGSDVITETWTYALPPL